MYMIVIPVRYLIEAGMYTTYFGKSLMESQIALGVLGLVAIVFALHVYLISGFRHLLAHMPRGHHDGIKMLPWKPLIIFISSLVASILQYSQPHTIPDSVAVLLTLGLSLSITFASRSLSASMRAGT